MSEYSQIIFLPFSMFVYYKQCGPEWHIGARCGTLWHGAARSGTLVDSAAGVARCNTPQHTKIINRKEQFYYNIPASKTCLILSCSYTSFFPQVLWFMARVLAQFQ